MKYLPALVTNWTSSRKNRQRRKGGIKANHLVYDDFMQVEIQLEKSPAEGAQTMTCLIPPWEVAPLIERLIQLRDNCDHWNDAYAKAKRAAYRAKHGIKCVKCVKCGGEYTPKKSDQHQLCPFCRGG